MLVYDITDGNSFAKIDHWYQELLTYCHTTEPPITMLIGNKADMKHVAQVSTSDALAYSKSNNLGFFETSAKTNSNVEKAFTTLVEGNIIFLNSFAPFSNFFFQIFSFFVSVSPFFLRLPSFFLFLFPNSFSDIVKEMKKKQMGDGGESHEDKPAVPIPKSKPIQLKQETAATTTETKKPEGGCCN